MAGRTKGMYAKGYYTSHMTKKKKVKPLTSKNVRKVAKKGRKKKYKSKRYM